MAKKITTEEERIARKYAKMDERLQKEVKEIEEDLREKMHDEALKIVKQRHFDKKCLFWYNVCYIIINIMKGLFS